MRLLVGLVLIGSLACLVACGQEEASPEARVRAALASLEAAAEAGDVAAFKQLVSVQYADDYGHDRRSLAAYLTFHLMRNQRARHVVTRIRSLELREGGVAEVTLHAGLAGSGGEAARLRADVYQVDLDLAHEDDGEWRLVWAQWSRAAPTDLL